MMQDVVFSLSNISIREKERFGKQKVKVGGLNMGIVKALERQMIGACARRNRRLIPSRVRGVATEEGGGYANRSSQEWASQAKLNLTLKARRFLQHLCIGIAYYLTIDANPALQNT